MAIAQKVLRILYQSKGNATGLTDVKAQVYFNGAAKAVGAAAILLSEVDSTNSPGLYELLIPAATLTTWGVAAGQYNCVEGYIDSASKSAKAPFREELTIASSDDINSVLGTPATTSIAGDIAAVQSKLGTPTGASVSADIAAIKSDTAAVKADLESGTSSLATILSNIQSLQNASIGNGVGFVLPTMLIPTSGNNTYRVPITIQNDNGALVDPASNTITVGVLNSSGADRGSYFSGSTGSPATIVATRTSQGQYYVNVSLPSSAIEEELVFSFAYSIGSNAMVRFGVSQVLVDGGAAGYALQATLLATQTTVNTINTAIGSATYGLAALQSLLTSGTFGLSIIAGLLNNATYGLSAINTNVSNVGAAVASANSSLTNATYGLSALQVQGAATQGTGFTAGTDDLHALSSFVRSNLYAGGRAV